MCTITKITRGNTNVYYPHLTSDGYNFCILAASGQVSLLIYENETDTEPCSIVPMYQNYDPSLSASRYSVCVKVPDAKNGLLYRYEVNGMTILDPAGVETTADLRYEGTSPRLPMCVARAIPVRPIRRPNLPYSRIVLHEVNAYAYTDKGYKGIVSKLDYLLSHCNTLSFTPLVQGDPNDADGINPVTGKPLREAWFYNPMMYYAPSANLASSRGNAVREIMDMVDAAHARGAEVAIDMVYNHTREGNNQGPVLHFKALGVERFYRMNAEGYLTDEHTGCGNELNVNDPMVVEFIIANLRYLYNVLGFDGVRFDLFAVLGQNPNLVDRILNDSELSGMKIYPEPWALGGLYMLGHCGLNTAEWNDQFRNNIREWVRGQYGFAKSFAACTTNHEGVFHMAQNHWSVNCITCHDGFTLEDLVSWNHKNNRGNGEDNRDGRDDNRSWNCGPDNSFNGPMDPATPGLSAEEVNHILSIPVEQREQVMAFRRQQKRNFNVALFLSQGIPFSLYGDEIGRTQLGNNNAYNQPELNRMPWEKLEDLKTVEELTFTQQLYSLRMYANPNEANIRRHGTTPRVPDLSDSARFSALETIPYSGSKRHLFWASNVHNASLGVVLPEPPVGTKWYRVLDTAQGYKVTPEGDEVVVGNKIDVAGWSNVVLISK